MRDTLGFACRPKQAQVCSRSHQGSRVREGVVANQLLEFWCLTNSRFGSAKLSSARSKCIQIDIVGLFWVWS